MCGICGIVIPDSSSRAIDESGFVPIGGIDQWIAIQGSDARNPVILFLHGGPAEAQSPVCAGSRRGQAAWQLFLPPTSTRLRTTLSRFPS